MTRSVFVTIATVAVLGPTGAATPASSSSPVILGDSVPIGTDHLMATTPDGATWVTWLDNQCLGTLRLQRIAPDDTILVPGGLVLAELAGCQILPTILTACSDDSVVAMGENQSFPVQRIDATGTPMWGAGVTVPGTAPGMVGALGLDGGDVLLAWVEASTVQVGRYAPDGTAVWPQPAQLAPFGGSRRFFAMITDGAGGAYLFWDQHSTYTKLISVARVTAAGAPAWAEPFVVVPIDGPPSFSGSSRHSDPVAVPDGSGGAVLVWVFGDETGTAPVPILMQGVTADGTRTLEPEGRRIALQTTRQFDPAVARDAQTGDVFITWRDGLLAPHGMRVQRMTLDGTRLWGDLGVHVSDIAVGIQSDFDASWSGDALSIVVSDEPVEPDDPTVRRHRVTSDGTVDATPCELSDVPAGLVRTVIAGESVVASWTEGTHLDSDVVAVRIDDDTPLFGDTNNDGVVDVDDLVNVILDWGTDGSAHGGDVDGDGLVTVDDVVAVILAWTV